MGAPPNGSPLFLIRVLRHLRVFGPAISRNAGYCITVFSGLVSEGSSVQAHRGRAAQSGVGVLNSGDHGLRGNRRGTGRKTEALQDSATGLARMDGGHDPHAPTTAMALENVHFPHAFHELSPGIVAWMATTGQGLLVTRGLFAGAAPVMSNGIRGVKCCC